MKKSVFANEAALCAAFISKLPDAWTAYPETAGFDILLVRKADGAQIGVEAKMSLNAKVILQAIGHDSDWYTGAGPDFRATLVPNGCAGAEMKQIAARFGVVTIEMMSDDHNEYEATADHRRYGLKGRRKVPFFSPELPVPKGVWRDIWTDHCPIDRCAIPEYVPDVGAGNPAPVQLSEWKVKAIKICIILERRGWVSIADFKHLQIDRSRWLQMSWLKLSELRGRYERGSRHLDLRKQHPVNYEQIAADYDKWAPANAPVPQGALL
jgi:hypothetical protein